MDDRLLSVGDCQTIDPCNPDPCSKKNLQCVPTRHVCLSPWETCQQYTCKVRVKDEHLLLETTCKHNDKVS